MTVIDLSPAQLERGREAAAHYGLTVTTEHGDMRDLSRFGSGAFDFVNQPYSLNFVPDARPEKGPPTLACPGLRDPHPARAKFEFALVRVLIILKRWARC